MRSSSEPCTNVIPQKSAVLFANPRADTSITAACTLKAKHKRVSKQERRIIRALLHTSIRAELAVLRAREQAASTLSTGGENHRPFNIAGRDELCSVRPWAVQSSGSLPRRCWLELPIYASGICLSRPVR